MNTVFTDVLPPLYSDLLDSKSTHMSWLDFTWLIGTEDQKEFYLELKL